MFYNIYDIDVLKTVEVFPEGGRWRSVVFLLEWETIVMI